MNVEEIKDFWVKVLLKQTCFDEKHIRQGLDNFFINNQPERSKREDFAYDFKIQERALATADQEYDAMSEFVKEAKMRCSELYGNIERLAEKTSPPSES